VEVFKDKIMKKKTNKNYYSFYFTALLLSAIIVGCNETDNTLAPYIGSPAMSNIYVEPGSFNPGITWVGGYVSVLGVNRGDRAALDSTLVFLIYQSGNGIKYPVRFGAVPGGAQDITSQFGETAIDSLNEDETYTYWVLKEDAWNQISAERNKYLVPDSTLSGTSVEIEADTILIPLQAHTQMTQSIDVYVNITNVTTFGQLGIISITPAASNNPTISWEITQSGITDTNISAIGLVEGQQYQPINSKWEMFSVDDSAGVTRYGKQNVISRPLSLGQNFPGTIVFVEYPPEGLERGKEYYIWIASKEWDGTSRLRFALGYAYATFRTN
jgi:hypothetical protein